MSDLRAAVNREEQVQWERRNGRYVAVVAVIAPLLLLAGFIYGNNSLGSFARDRSDLFLEAVNRHSGPYVFAGVLFALGTILLIPVFLFLYRAISFRRKELPRIALHLAVIAPLAVGVVGVVRQVEIVNTAHQWVKHPPGPTTAAEKQKLQKITNPKDYATAVDNLTPDKKAEKKLQQGSLKTVAIVGLVANLLLAGEFILLGLNGMRSGILSKFMGILGVIIGGLYVIPLFGDPAIIEFFWLIALALIIADRWPQGRGPAWDSGEAIPWPTAQQRQEAMRAEREGGRPAPRPASAAAGGATAAEEGSVATAVEAPQHPRSKKRKRKRRS